MQLKPFFKYTLFFGLFLSATLAFAQTDKQAELERQRRIEEARAAAAASAAAAVVIK